MSKTYRVCGQHHVLGQPPGTVFVAELDPAQEDRMLERGSLQLEDDTPKWAEQKKPDEGDKNDARPGRKTSSRRESSSWFDAIDTEGANEKQQDPPSSVELGERKSASKSGPSQP